MPKGKTAKALKQSDDKRGEVITKLGIKLHDVIIVDFGTSISAAFASQLEEQKRTAKRHSYIIVGKKAFF